MNNIIKFLVINDQPHSRFLVNVMKHVSFFDSSLSTRNIYQNRSRNKMKLIENIEVYDISARSIFLIKC